MRVKWFEAEQSIEKLNFGCLEVSEMKNLANRFYNCCVLKNSNAKDILRLFEARGYLEGCLTYLRSLIEPADNILIIKATAEQDTHDLLEKYFDNLLAVMDTEIKESKKQIEDTSIGISNSYLVRVNIKLFREKLVDYMNNLVLMPITRALLIYKEFKAKKMKIKLKDKEISDREIFEYILFREVYVSAKIKGAPTRQKVSASSGMGGLNITERNIVKQGRAKRSEDFIVQRAESPPSIQSIPEHFEDFSYEENEDEDDEEDKDE